MMMEPLVMMVFAYTGQPLFRLPYTKCSWGESYGEAGSLSVTVDYTRTALRIPGGLWGSLKLWGSVLAVMRGREVVHAGPLTDFDYDRPNRSLGLTCGGGVTFLSRRLVMSHDLDSAWKNGDVLVDEDHPAGDWEQTYTGSYGDIAYGLIASALEWGALPYDLPLADGGDAHTKSYDGWDLAKVTDRLDDLQNLEDGPEIRFDPYVTADDWLRWRLRVGTPELIDNTWVWNATVPGQRAMLQHVVGSGAAMTGQAYAAGGKDAEKTVLARYVDTNPPKGYPVLQSANTSHTTVSEPDTLEAYAEADVTAGRRPDVTYQLTVGGEYAVHVGDHASLLVDDDFLGRRDLGLKITDVSGSSDSDWLTLQAREAVA